MGMSYVTSLMDLLEGVKWCKEIKIKEFNQVMQRSPREVQEFDATTCWIYSEALNSDEMRDHCYITEYPEPAYSACNLKVSPRPGKKKYKYKWYSIFSEDMIRQNIGGIVNVIDENLTINVIPNNMEHCSATRQ